MQLLIISFVIRPVGATARAGPDVHFPFKTSMADGEEA
jgi:hypothetical protein